MKILNLTLCDYNRLRVSRIQELEINTESDNIQLIIGSNGSGKSSIMHELFPYPSIKSSFGKNGFKSLSLHHNNVLYKITYHPAYGHQFFRDESDNMNVSMTNEIQKELIREHLGVTPEIHTLLKGALDICGMVPSRRKQVLMSMNPIDVSVFLEKYQKVHKNVVAYSNNLDRLYERQKKLMTQKIPDEQYQKMLERKAILENQEKLLLIWMTTVNSELELYPEVTGRTSPDRNLLEDFYTLFKKLPKFSNVSRSKYKSNLVACSTRSEMITAELNELETTIEDTVGILNDYESKKASLHKDGCNVEEELSNILLQMKSFEFSKGFDPIPEDQISTVNMYVNTIRDILVELSYIEYSKIVEKSELNVIYKKLLRTKSELDNIEKSISQSVQQRDELIKTIKSYNTGKNCEKESCELHVAYSIHNDTKKNHVTHLNDIIDKTTSEHSILKEKFAADHVEYETQCMIWKYIDKVIDIISSNRNLSRNFNTEFVLTRIRESALLLVSDITSHVDQSISHSEFTKLLLRSRELESINASLASKKQLSMEILNAEILTHTKRLNTLRKKHENKQKNIDRLLSEKILLEEYSEVKQQVLDLSAEISELEENVVRKSSREYIRKLYDVLNGILKSVRSEMVDITTISKDQEMLIVRLDTEVNNIIAELKPKYDAAKIIEKSLAELPVEYTKSFVNNIIETTNYFINEIMTYPMYMKSIDDDSILDFTFPVVVENGIPVLVKDISECSLGQRSIIQLAFNLAMVVELKLNDYPIYLDEVDRFLDTTHSQRLTDMIISLVDTGIVSQLFVIGHHTSMLDAFSNSENITVLNGDNILLPEFYNKNTKIVYY